MPSGAIMQAVRIILACLSIAASATAAQAADSEVVIPLASGRPFRGSIDSTSTNRQLVLRVFNGGITLLRPIAWERVVSAAINGDVIDAARLRERAVKESGAGDDRVRVPKKIELRDETYATDASV